MPNVLNTPRSKVSVCRKVKRPHGYTGRRVRAYQSSLPGEAPFNEPEGNMLRSSEPMALMAGCHPIGSIAIPGVNASSPLLAEMGGLL